MSWANSDNYMNYKFNAEPQLDVGRQRTVIINAIVLTEEIWRRFRTKLIWKIIEIIYKSWKYIFVV